MSQLPLPGNFLNEMSSSYEKITSTCMFFATPFTMTNSWDQPIGSSTYDCTKKNLIKKKRLKFCVCLKMDANENHDT